MSKVDLIIFRVPDENGDMQFVEMSYLNGHLSTTGKTFTILPENDNYREMHYDHIVLAHRIPGGSRDVNRFSIGDREGHPIKVYEMPFDDLRKTVNHLIEQNQSYH